MKRSIYAFAIVIIQFPGVEFFDHPQNPLFIYNVL